MGEAPSNDIHEEVALPPSWHLVERTRSLVAERLGAVDAELREAAVMVASELAENVIHHGELLPDNGWGRVIFDVVEGRIELESVSGATAARARDALAHVESIRTGSPEQLYLERLREMLEFPERGGGRLGMYRIAFEGGFDLSAEYADGVLRIMARRELSEAR